MTPWRPALALDRLTAALEAEILAAPQAEVRGLIREAAAVEDPEALRALVARAVEAAEERAALPPEARPGSVLRGL